MGLTPKRLPRQFNRPASKKVQRYIKKRKRVSPLQSMRFKRSARKFKKITDFIKQYGVKIALSFLLVLGIIVFIVLIFSPIITVRSISFDDSTLRIDKETVQTALKPLFGQHLFLITRAEVLPLLQEVYPDVRNVQLTKDYPDTLRLAFELYPLVAQLEIQDEQPAEPVETGTGAIAQNTHFVTETGLYVRLAIPTEEELTLPTYLLVDWSVRPQQNQQLLTQEFLEAVQQTEEILTEQFGHTITKRTIFVRAQEYHLEIGDRTLWFDVRNTVEEQLDRYRTFLETQINFPVTEYIDLRLADRIIWK